VSEGGIGSRVPKRLSGDASPYRLWNGRGGKVARTVPVSEGGIGSRVPKRLSGDPSPYRLWNGRGGKVARTVPVSVGPQMTVKNLRSSAASTVDVARGLGPGQLGRLNGTFRLTAIRFMGGGVLVEDFEVPDGLPLNGLGSWWESVDLPLRAGPKRRRRCALPRALQNTVVLPTP
jgi:hypothetical protein